MNLPGIFSFSVTYSVDGKPIPFFSENYNKAIEVYDPLWGMRVKCAREIDGHFVQRIISLLGLCDVYSRVLSQTKIHKSVANALLLNIVEQAIKQGVNDLDAMMKDFIKLVDNYRGRYTNLFKKNAQKKLIEVLIKGDPEKEKEYQQKSEVINTKRIELFLYFNSHGVPKHESFIQLKDKISELRNSINTYRDKVAAHPEKDIELSWSTFDNCITKFKSIAFDFYEVVSFFTPPTTKANGIDPDGTAEYLINGIFERKS